MTIRALEKDAESGEESCHWGIHPYSLRGQRTLVRSDLARDARYDYCGFHPRFFSGLRHDLICGPGDSACGLTRTGLGEREAVHDLLTREHNLMPEGQSLSGARASPAATSRNRLSLDRLNVCISAKLLTLAAAFWQ